MKISELNTKEVKVQTVPMLEVGLDNIPTKWVYFIRLEDSDNNHIVCEIKFLEEYLKKIREEITIAELKNPIPTFPVVDTTEPVEK